jgi:hypothetical protein
MIPLYHKVMTQFEKSDRGMMMFLDLVKSMSEGLKVHKSRKQCCDICSPQHSKSINTLLNVQEPSSSSWQKMLQMTSANALSTFLLVLALKNIGRRAPTAPSPSTVDTFPWLSMSHLLPTTFTSILFLSFTLWMSSMKEFTCSKETWQVMK